MSAQLTMSDKQELFRRSWRRCQKELCRRPCGGNCAICHPPAWLVVKLLELVAPEVPETIRGLTPAIRKLIEESQYVGDACEALPGTRPRPPIDRQLNLVMATLELVKRCEAPVAEMTSRPADGVANLPCDRACTTGKPAPDGPKSAIPQTADLA